MAQFAFDPQERSETNEQGIRGGPSNLKRVEKVLQITQTQQKAVRVLIADQDSMNSNLLASALSNEQPFKGEPIHPAELLSTLGTTEVDLVVIAVDVNSNPGSSLELASTVCRTYPDISVVMLVNQLTNELVINAFRSGARGVFFRQRAMSEFFDCIKHVAKGFLWAGKQETNALLEALQSIPAPSMLCGRDSPELTERELQVVQYAAKGKTNRTIASELRLSEHTVKNYLFRAFEKLGVSNRVELLFYLTVRGHTFSATKADTLEDD